MKTKSECTCMCCFERTRLRGSSLFATNQECGERANIIVLPSDFYAIVGCRDTCTPPHIEGHCAARANTLSHQPTSPPGHNMRIWRAVTLGTPREHFPLGPKPGRTRHWAFVYFCVCDMCVMHLYIYHYSRYLQVGGINFAYIRREINFLGRRCICNLTSRALV